MRYMTSWCPNGRGTCARSQDNEIDIEVINDAEYLLLLAAGANNTIRRGFGVASACPRIARAADELILAKCFARSSPGLQLAAMVEDWTAQQIETVLNKMESNRRDLLPMP